MDIFVLEIGLAAALGAICTALLGWTESGEPFDVRKFMSSVIRAIIGGAAIAIAFDYSSASGPLSYLIAFVAGAGVDAGGNRIAASIAVRMKKG